MAKRKETLQERKKRESVNFHRRAIYERLKGVTSKRERKRVTAAYWIELEDKKRQVAARNKFIQSERKRIALGKRNYKKVLKQGLAMGIDFTKFVDAVDLEMLHADGTVAVQPSLLRHIGNRELNMERLIFAEAEDNLDQTARDMAREFEVELHEVYTFMMSP